MSQEENKAIEKLMVTEVLNKGNLDYLDKYLAPNFVYHSSGGREVRGIEEYRQFISQLRTAYPDLYVQIEDIIAGGDMVATRTTSTFTYTGKVGYAVPTGKKATMLSSAIDRFEGGKLAETWEYYDRLDLLQQLGLIPIKPPPS